MIREAGRNSVRHFLLRERKVDGIDEGLIADSAMRVQLDKAALLQINPSACFESTDEHTARRFRDWLGKRYQRPAIPDEHVAAIQRPIVNAIGKLSAKDKIQVLLQGVKEILFLATGDSEPYQVQLVFLRMKQIPNPYAQKMNSRNLEAGWEMFSKRGAGQSW